MDINATLLGQMITFALFVWFTMKFVWPPLNQALQKRRSTIAEGLAAAEKSMRDLQASEAQIQKTLANARVDAAKIVEEAHKQAGLIVDDAKTRAKEEAERLLHKAHTEIEQEVQQAKESLRKEVGRIVILGAEKIIAREIDASSHQALLDQLVNEI